MDKNLMKELAYKYPDKILSPFDFILNELGFEAISTLADYFGGSTLYIPTERRIFGPCCAEEMKREFNGGNYKDLAKKYDVCERTVRYIISQDKKGKQWKKP